MEAFLSAASNLLQPTYWAAVFAAILVGTLVGFVPGVGATLVTALMLPFVVFTIEEPAIGIVFLAMVGSLNNTLNAIPAVLVGLPEGETQVTYYEGHQLARRGHAAHTLGAVYAVSAMGGLVGAAALLLIIPVITPFILQFSYTEIAVLALFGISMVSILSRGAKVKGVAGGLFGVLLATVGVDPMTGIPRFTLGQTSLWEGLPIITTILGFFALPELVDLIMTRRSVAPKGTRVSRSDVLSGALYGVRTWPTVIRQSLFGAFMGAVPGIGGSVIDWLSYGLGISLHKRKRGESANFGKGSLDGVLFAESASNSKAGGQALPTLTLGVPGSTSWAIIIVALLAYDIAPGPEMVGRHADVTMLMVLTLAIGNLIVSCLGLVATNWLARITQVPYPTVGFMIMAMACLAVLAENAGWLSVVILLLFGGAGLLMKRYGWPRPPLVLGFILGPIVDLNLQSALNTYGLLGIVTRPITITLFIILVVSVFALSRLMRGETDTGSGLPAEGQSMTHQSAAGMKASPERAPSAGGARGGRPTGSRRVGSHLWQEENLMPVIVASAAAIFVIAAFDYPTGAGALPIVLGLAVVALSAMQLVRQVLYGRADGEQVMDIGIRSTGMEGAKEGGITIIGLLCLFLLLGTLVGLQYGAVVLATLGPVILLSGKQRWISGAVSGGAVYLFSGILMERLTGVIWPQPIVLDWLQVLFS